MSFSLFCGKTFNALVVESGFVLWVYTNSSTLNCPSNIMERNLFFSE